MIEKVYIHFLAAFENISKMWMGKKNFHLFITFPKVPLLELSVQCFENNVSAKYLPLLLLFISSLS